MDHIIGGKYKLGRKIESGYGSSMEVYVGTDNQSGKEFAVIMEYVKTEHPQLRKESEFYRLLQGGTGIPHFEWFGVEGECNIMVVELLGKDLYSLFRSCGRKFSLKTVLMLADQMLDQLEYMHDKGYLHRYIVPRNLLMGSGHNADQVYMVNYRYLSTRECMHCSENKGFIGDARYASANAHWKGSGTHVPTDAILLDDYAS